MKLFVSGLLALYVFVHFNTSTIYADIIEPLKKNNTVYLVGYSAGWYNDSWECIKSTAVNSTDNWMERILYFAFRTTSYWINVSVGFEITLNTSYITVGPEGWVQGQFNAGDIYSILIYTNDSFVLSDSTGRFSNPPCSLWMTRPTTNISEVPETTNATFFGRCPNATFFGYDNSFCLAQK
uniref:Putative group viii salivary lipocalin n=1 Tax=Rhipicephalus pulchellus TaxID=72859 RepID=L7MBY1_RHIPC